MTVQLECPIDRVPFSYEISEITVNFGVTENKNLNMFSLRIAHIPPDGSTSSPFSGRIYLKEGEQIHFKSSQIVNELGEALNSVKFNNNSNLVITPTIYKETIDYFSITCPRGHTSTYQIEIDGTQAHQVDEP